MKIFLNPCIKENKILTEGIKEILSREKFMLKYSRTDLMLFRIEYQRWKDLY